MIQDVIGRATISANGHTNRQRVVLSFARRIQFKFSI